MNSRVAVGQDVMTTSGLYGTITAFDDESAHSRSPPALCFALPAEPWRAVAKPTDPAAGVTRQL